MASSVSICTLKTIFAVACSSLESGTPENILTRKIGIRIAAFFTSEIFRFGKLKVILENTNILYVLKENIDKLVTGTLINRHIPSFGKDL